MTYTAVFVDLDGTIVDSAPGIFHCFEHTFRMLHREAPSREVMRPFLGPPLTTTFGDILGMSGDELERAIAIYRAEYAAGGAITADLFPGVMDVVHKLLVIVAVVVAQLRVGFNVGGGEYAET